MTAAKMDPFTIASCLLDDKINAIRDRQLDFMIGDDYAQLRLCPPNGTQFKRPGVDMDLAIRSSRCRRAHGGRGCLG
jgi:hypothetical protein